MKYLFLDIDGVLNTHFRHPNGYCTLEVPKVRLLEDIVADTGCKIVVSSAWRYLVLSGSMTIVGLRNLFATYGWGWWEKGEALCDILPADVNPNDPQDRAKLVLAYMDTHPHEAAVAVDDLPLGYKEHGIPFVQTDGMIGLTEAKVMEIVRLLSNRQLPKLIRSEQC